MRDLFRANLRRDLVTAGMLLAFATVAMAAAQWGTFSPKEPAALTGEKDGAFASDVDRKLPSSSADLARVPMFTTGRSPIAEGSLPAEPVLPPAPEAAAASAAVSVKGFGTWSDGRSWQSNAGFGSGERSPFVRGASSASSGASIAGMGGGGAWGGVSGTAAPKTKETVVAGASAKVVVKSSTPPRAAAANSGKGGSSSSGQTTSLSGNPVFSAMAAGPAPAAAPAAQAALAFTPGTEASLKDPALATLRDRPSDSPSSAPTPEPLSFILVGVGLAGVYAVRKHLR